MAALCITALLACIGNQPAAGHNYCPKAECEKVKQKIRKIESRMRQGYSRAEGERMSEQLRELRAMRSRRCR